MGYSLYRDERALEYGVIREAGYAVSALCDWPECPERIDRGMAFLCDDHGHFTPFEEDEKEPWVEVEGCGLYFCALHLDRTGQHAGLTPKTDADE